ncbi:MAG: helix-turn-helix domain-containing protein, partial [Catenulispora sp.]|nr:helix-turn-helix domain-containing protein [Catenulispora sp.]
MEPANPTDGQILGHRLAMARYQAGLSVDQVADVTRIRSGMVREIEAGDFIHCGGDVYARGHVRAIAKCVGIDPEPLLAAHPPVVPMELPTRSRSRIVPRTEASTASEESETDAATAQKSRKSASRPASNAVPTSAARDKAARFAARVPSRVIRPAAEGATLTITTSGAGTAGS